MLPLGVEQGMCVSSVLWPVGRREREVMWICWWRWKKGEVFWISLIFFGYGRAAGLPRPRGRTRGSPPDHSGAHLGGGCAAVRDDRVYLIQHSPGPHEPLLWIDASGYEPAISPLRKRQIDLRIRNDFELLIINRDALFPHMMHAFLVHQLRTILLLALPGCRLGRDRARRGRFGKASGPEGPAEFYRSGRCALARGVRESENAGQPGAQVGSVLFELAFVCIVGFFQRKLHV